MNRSLISWLFKLAVSATLLALVFNALPLSDLIGALGRADPFLVLVAYITMPPVLYMGAVQFWVLTKAQGMSQSVRQILTVNLATQFYGLFLPGSLAGGAIRWYKLARPEGKRAESLAVILFNRMVEVAVAVGLGLAFWLADPLARDEDWVLALFGVLALALVVGYVMLFGTNNISLRIAVRFKPRGILATPWDKLIKALQSCGRFGGLGAGRVTAVVGLTLASHLLSVLSMVLLARALSLDVSAATLGWIRSVSTLLMMLPISWLGLGVREGSFLLLLAPFGVPAGSAVALSLLMFVRGILGGVSGGLLEAWAFFSVQRRNTA